MTRWPTGRGRPTAGDNESVALVRGIAGKSAEVHGPPVSAETERAKRDASLAGMTHAASSKSGRGRAIATSGTVARWGITVLLVLMLGGIAHTQAPKKSVDGAVLAEALTTLRGAAPAPAGAPESVGEAEARVAQAREACRRANRATRAAAHQARVAQAREACRAIPNPTARAICTGVLGLAVALDVGVPVVVDLLSEDGAALDREQQDVLERLDALEKWRESTDEWRASTDEWRESTDDRLSQMDGKLDVIIELLRTR